MSKSMLKVSDFLTTNISISTPKVNQNGGKNITVSYKFEDMVVGMIFQTPRMLSFGINKWTDPKNPTGEPICSVTLSFLGSEVNEKLRDFHTILDQLDEWAIQTALTNCWEWLGRKNLSRETIQAIYTKTIKIPIDKVTGEPNGKPHNMKLKLKSNASGYMATFFDKDKVSISNSDIEQIFNKGSHVRSLIQCTGIWIAAGKFGLTWKIIQMVVEPRPNTNIGAAYAFDDDDEITVKSIDQK
jgi:hypothetical protein